MTLVVFSVLLLSLSFYAVPAVLSRLTRFRQSTDQFVGAVPTSGQVFTNASIAYAIQMATFGPFFAWGASGELIPGLLNSLFFGLGLLLIYMFRRGIVTFVSQNIDQSTSLTVHGYMAAAHKNSDAIRIISSCLTIIALWGLVTGEVIGTATIIRVLVSESQIITYAIMLGMLLLMFLYTILGGNRGVMQVDQIQLALAYIGLFGVFGVIAAFELLSVHNPTAPFSILCTLILAICSITVLFIRRGKFVDFSSDIIQDPYMGHSHEMRNIERIFKSIQRNLNSIVLIIVLAATSALLIYSVRFLAGSSLPAVATSSSHTSLSWIALISLALLPLFYQIVDISNWQRIAALVQRDSSGKGSINAASFRSDFLKYALEAPVVWILLLAFGGLAVAYVGPLEAADPFGDFVRKLMAGGLLGGLLISLLVMAVFAIALSTMDAVLSASLFAFRYDILPFLRSMQGNDQEVAETAAVRATSVFGIISYLIVFTAYVILDGLVSFGTSAYLSVLIGFYTAQLAFVPLLFGALQSTGRKGRLSAPLTSSVAIAVLLSGAMTGLGITVVGLATGNEQLTWWAAPGCLVVSAVAFIFGRIICRKAISTNEGV